MAAGAAVAVLMSCKLKFVLRNDAAHQGLRAKVRGAGRRIMATHEKRTAVIHGQKRCGWSQAELYLSRVPVVVEIDALSLCQRTAARDSQSLQLRCG